MKIVGVILASGRGERTGSYVPKQFVKVNGRRLIDYVIDAFEDAGIDIAITLPPDYTDKILSKRNDIVLIKGAKERADTIRNTFPVLEQMKADYVIYHDSARPLITPQVLLAVKEQLLSGCDVLVSGTPITDSLLCLQPLECLERTPYRLIQTPEAFKVSKLLDAYRTANFIHPTLISYPLLNDPTLQVFNPEFYNFKVTFTEDIRIAEKLLVDDYLPPAQLPDPNNLKNKHVCILGGSGGIGSAILHELKKYCSVFAPSRKEIDLSGNWKFPEEKYDHLVYAAGLCYDDQHILDIELRNMFEVNVYSVNAIMKYAPYHINSGGSILIIGSSSSTMGRSGFGLYSASKAAANSLVQAYGPILHHAGFRVNSLCPTKTNTPMVKKTATELDMEYILEPEYVAKVAVRSLLVQESGKIWYLYKGLDKERK